jgi:hypothetical protein
MSTVPVRQPLSSPKKTLSAVPSPAPKPKAPEPLQLPVQQDKRAFQAALWVHVQHSVELAGDVERRKQQKWSPMFSFVRELMRFSLPKNLRDDPWRLAILLRNLHEEWFDKLEDEGEASPNFWDHHKRELKGEDDEDFVSMWSCMENPPGADPLLAAWALTWTDPMMIDIPGKSFDYTRLLATARQLQMIVGDQNILLPQDRLAEILSSSQRSMSRYIRHAVHQGHLLLVRPHRYATKQAAEYRYLFERARRSELPAVKFQARKVN